MVQGLLSVITPCYNTGNIVHRLLDSILLQDYPDIEMFIVDDGSTDNTKNVIDRYISKFKEKGYTLTYIYQENSGQSVAINNALKYCKGEFLTWPDSDDYLATNDIYSKLITELSKDSKSSIARCLPTFVSEIDLSVINRHEWCQNKKDIFEDCLFDRNGFWFQPICYISKMTVFDEMYPTRSIYTEKNAGQNWQMMLPLFYRHDCLTIQVYGAYILERYASHSRGQYHSYEQKNEKFESYRRTIVATLQGMDVAVHSYISRINSYYYCLQIALAANEGKSSNIRYFYNCLKKISGVKIGAKYHIHYLLSFLPFRKIVLSFIRSFYD